MVTPAITTVVMQDDQATGDVVEPVAPVAQHPAHAGLFDAMPLPAAPAPIEPTAEAASDEATAEAADAANASGTPAQAAVEGDATQRDAS